MSEFVMHNANPNWSLLAGVRWLLASGILMCHLFLVDSTHPVARFAGQLNGLALVGSFLIISGYSISHSIQARPGGFLMRRVERIYPVYLAALFFAVLPFIIFGPVLQMPGAPVEIPTIPQFIASAFMLQVTIAPPIANFGPSWSLAVECFFYLCAPLLVKVGLRWVAGLLIVSALCYMLQSFGFLPGGSVYYNQMLAMFPAIYLYWFWLLGWLLERNRESQLAFIACLITPALLITNPHSAGRLAGVVITTTLLAIVYGHRLQLPHKAKKITLYLGDLSYPLFLVHIPIFYLVYNGTQTTLFWPYIAASLLVALLIFHVIDKPRRAHLNAPSRSNYKPTE